MFEIPNDRLPPGFAESVDESPARPADPRPAATTVLLRDGPSADIEALLMRRHRQSGFVPGAWVFPGGRVDSADSAPALYERIRGLATDPVPRGAFWTAALRELFEETGVLLARTPEGDWAPAASSDGGMEARRRAVMDDESSIMDVLQELDLVLDAEPMVHIAHWVTPVAEPRRYDTHFFAVPLPEDREAAPDAREMTDALWVSPDDALGRFQDGDLPMVFPTVRTLESLQGYDSVEHALDSFRHRTVRRILPRLVRTERGVAIQVDDD